MELHFLTYGTQEELIKKAAFIKKSGMKCVGVFKRELVETATGKHVMDLCEFVFKGNPLQYIRAKSIINKTANTTKSVIRNINPI